MKQNNRKNTWKAIVAVMLVMTTLFSISTAVSADFVETVFEEVCELMRTSSSNTGICTPNYDTCPKCFVKKSVTYTCIPGCRNKDHKGERELGTCQC